MNSTSLHALLFVLACLAIALTDQASLVASKTPTRRQVSSGDEQILLYRVNDENSVFIVNKANNKFKLYETVDDKLHSIKNNFDHTSDTVEVDAMFTLLYADEKSMLVGARNRLFNFSTEDLSDQESLNKVSFVFKFESISTLAMVNRIFGTNVLPSPVFLDI